MVCGTDCIFIMYYYYITCGFTIYHNGNYICHKSPNLTYSQPIAVIISATLLNIGNNICHGICSTSAITYCCYILHSIVQNNFKLALTSATVSNFGKIQSVPHTITSWYKIKILNY